MTKTTGELSSKGRMTVIPEPGSPSHFEPGKRKYGAGLQKIWCKKCSSYSSSIRRCSLLGSRKDKVISTIKGLTFIIRADEVRLPIGYTVPQFHMYNGYGCPRRHLVRFLAQCGDTVHSQALLLRQFVLSPEGEAFEWLVLLLTASICPGLGHHGKKE